MSYSAESSNLPTATDILAAADRIRDVVPVTPCFRARDLEESLSQPLWLKAESLQRTGSFKVRGALNWIRTARRDELERGLITVSAGNHAMALAWAARQVGAPLTVLMPEGASRLKIDATRAYGAEVIVHGTIADAVARTREMERERGLTLVHPYDEPRVMAGQGTVGLELLDQVPEAARVLCPVGGGGLVSGIGIAMKSVRPDLELVGVEPAGAATMCNAWRAGRADAALESVDTIAASLAPAVVGRYTYEASRRVVDEIVTVSDVAIREATLELILKGRLYVETGGSAGLAALLEGRVAADPARPTVLVVTGGNMDLSQIDSLAVQAPR